MIKLRGITIDDVSVTVDTITGSGIGFLGSEVFLQKLSVVLSALVLKADCEEGAISLT